LILNPAKFSTEERWYRAVLSLAPGAAARNVDPLRALFLLVADPEGAFSIVKCISGARDNARQVREEISSEMWEHLNRLYHDVTGSELQPDDDADAMRMVGLVREGSYRFSGITAATMNHDEAWHFIQLGKYIERACNLCVLLDAYFVVGKHADDLDWVGLLSSCAAFEAYCKACTAELKPERIANFLLLKPEFPYSVRYSLDRMHEALTAISNLSLSRRTEKIERLIGRLRSMVAYVQIGEIIGGLHKYLTGIIEQCRDLHAAVHEVYIEYPIEVAFET
jgi:uncharacterized alpha-E superfamily protein